MTVEALKLAKIYQLFYKLLIIEPKYWENTSHEDKINENNKLIFTKKCSYVNQFVSFTKTFQNLDPNLKRENEASISKSNFTFTPSYMSTQCISL